MVEITYQMVLSTIQTASLVVGIIYYLTIMRNQQKSQQIQMLQRLHDTKYDVEGLQHYYESMTLKWDTFNEYVQKYGYQNDPQVASIIESQTSYFEGLGMLVKNNAVDLNTLYEIMGNRIIGFWFKFETVIKEYRQVIVFSPGSEYSLNFEYLANEMINIRKQKGSTFPVHRLHPTSTLLKDFNPT